jgi:hypothetical protein
VAHLDLIIRIPTGMKDGMTVERNKERNKEKERTIDR